MNSDRRLIYDSVLQESVPEENFLLIFHRLLVYFCIIIYLLANLSSFFLSLFIYTCSRMLVEGSKIPFRCRKQDGRSNRSFPSFLVHVCHESLTQHFAQTATYRCCAGRMIQFLLRFSGFDHRMLQIAYNKQFRNLFTSTTLRNFNRNFLFSLRYYVKNN